MSKPALSNDSFFCRGGTGKQTLSVAGDRTIWLSAEEKDDGSFCLW